MFIARMVKSLHHKKEGPHLFFKLSGARGGVSLGLKGLGKERTWVPREDRVWGKDATSILFVRLVFSTTILGSQQR